MVNTGTVTVVRLFELVAETLPHAGATTRKKIRIASEPI